MRIKFNTRNIVNSLRYLDAYKGVFVNTIYENINNYSGSIHNLNDRSKITIITIY